MKKWIIGIGVGVVVAGLATYAALAGTPHVQSQQLQVQQFPVDGIRKPDFLDPNPVIHDSGRRVVGTARHGRWGRQRQVVTHREVVHATAMDPDRDRVDQGSLMYLDRLVTDSQGGYYRQRGCFWTSNGVPHEDVTLTRVYRNSRRVIRRDSTHIQKTSPMGTDK